jgi:GNAT superfamily N-acetyltransferase
MISTTNEKFKLRFATREDAGLILGFIKELAEYEKLLHEVKATEESLLESIFDKGRAEVIIGEYDGKAVGMALFFHNYSTFLGKAGIYLEDLYIQPEYRGEGLGKILLRYLAKLCIERDCGRLEWSCLDWNEPSIAFYKKIGAVPMEEWTVFRVTGENLDKLAKS